MNLKLEMKAGIQSSFLIITLSIMANKEKFITLGKVLAKFGFVELIARSSLKKYLPDKVKSNVEEYSHFHKSLLVVH
jgi:hypothetical protein